MDWGRRRRLGWIDDQIVHDRKGRVRERLVRVVGRQGLELLEEGIDEGSVKRTNAGRDFVCEGGIVCRHIRCFEKEKQGSKPESKVESQFGKGPESVQTADVPGNEDSGRGDNAGSRGQCQIQDISHSLGSLTETPLDQFQRAAECRRADVGQCRLQ